MGILKELPRRIGAMDSADLSTPILESYREEIRGGQADIMDIFMLVLDFVGPPIFAHK